MPPNCTTCNVTFPSAAFKKKHDRETHENEINVTFKDKVVRRVYRQNGVFSCSCSYNHINSNNFRMHGQVHNAPTEAALSTAGTPASTTPTIVAPVAPASAPTMKPVPIVAPSPTEGREKGAVGEASGIAAGSSALKRAYPGPGESALQETLEDIPVIRQPADPASIPACLPLDPPPPSSPQIPPEEPRSPVKPLSPQPAVAPPLSPKIPTEGPQPALPAPPVFPEPLTEEESETKRRRIGDVVATDVDVNVDVNVDVSVGVDIDVVDVDVEKISAAAATITRESVLNVSASATATKPTPAKAHKTYNINPLFLPPIWTAWPGYGDPAFITRMAGMTAIECPGDPEVFGFVRETATRMIREAITFINNQAPEMFGRKLLTSVGAISEEKFTVANPAEVETLFVRYILFLLRICSDDIPLEDFNRCRMETSHHMWQVRNVLVGVIKANFSEKQYMQYVGVFAGCGLNSHVVKIEDYQSSGILNFVTLLAWRDGRFVTGWEMYELLQKVDSMSRTVMGGLTLLDYSVEVAAGTAPILTGKPDPAREFQAYELLSVDGSFGVSGLSRSLHLMELVGYGCTSADKPTDFSTSTSRTFITMGDLRKVVLVSLADIEEKLRSMSFGVELAMDLSAVQDDISNSNHGYSFAQDERNGFDRRYLQRVVRRDPALLGKVVAGNAVNVDFFDAYSSYYGRCLELIATVIAICCGEIFEPEDCARLIVENGGGHSRNLYIVGGHMYMAWRAIGSDVIRIQILPNDLAVMLCRVIVYVVPFMEWMKQTVAAKSPLEWAHPILPRTFFTVSTRAIPGSSIRTIVRGQRAIKVDLTPKLLQNAVLKLKNQCGVNPRTSIVRRLELLPSSLSPRLLAVNQQNFVDAKKEMVWLDNLMTKEMIQMHPVKYRDHEKDDIKRKYLDIRPSIDPTRRLLAEFKEINDSCIEKRTKAVIFVRSAAMVQMIMAVGDTPEHPYQVVDAEKEAGVLEKWIDDQLNHLLIIPFSQFDALMPMKGEIGWIMHSGSCGDISTLLSHCQLADCGVVIYMPYEPTFNSIPSTKDEAAMQQLIQGCRKKALYWHMGLPGGDCHEEKCTKCNYCKANEEFSGVKAALRYIVTNKFCGFCIIHRSRATHHSRIKDNQCPFLSDAALAPLMKGIRFRISFVPSCCKVCGLPASWCPDKCQYQALPSLLCATALTDDELKRNLAALKIDPGRKVAEYLLAGEERNGMALVLQALFKGGCFQFHGPPLN
ncbi:hypothetical protein TWF730_001759 [Orbilia blumenaviensis]|uniref:C2H2-type domain-containing protein n=1 Tax=Orbilia blumenaviensis TaxID=1796055 RepID=A0AAV9UIV2_9PEZI